MSNQSNPTPAMPISDERLATALAHLEQSCRADKKFYAACIRELTAARRELLEQARLLGAGSEREARLLAERNEARRRLGECEADARRLDWMEQRLISHGSFDMKRIQLSAECYATEHPLRAAVDAAIDAALASKS